MTESDQIPLSAQLMAVMRNAAHKALTGREPFITPRLLLLALLDDPDVGPPIAAVVNREKLAAVAPSEKETLGVTRLPDERLGADEPPALVRYDTLAFKAPDGRSSVWLNRDAYHIFIEGAQRVEDRYLPKHLALGLAAEAVRQPGILAAIRVEPGVLTDAVYKL